MLNKAYTPIACQLYDALEMLSMRKAVCNISYKADGVTKTIEGKIVDLFPISGIEYLKLDNGKTLRLDLLLAINDIVFSGEGSCNL